MNEEPRPPHIQPDGDRKRPGRRKHRDGRKGGVDDKREVERTSVPPRLVAAVLVVVALIFFVVQNDEEVAFSWLVFDMSGPLWVVIVLAALAGAVLAEVLGFLRRRRRPRR